MAATVEQPASTHDRRRRRLRRLVFGDHPLLRDPLDLLRLFFAAAAFTPVDTPPSKPPGCRGFIGAAVGRRTAYPGCNGHTRGGGWPGIVAAGADGDQMVDISGT